MVRPCAPFPGAAVDLNIIYEVAVDGVAEFSCLLYLPLRGQGLGDTQRKRPNRKQYPLLKGIISLKGAQKYGISASDPAFGG
jgi:hypothetical protein